MKPQYLIPIGGMNDDSFSIAETGNLRVYQLHINNNNVFITGVQVIQYINKTKLESKVETYDINLKEYKF